MAARLKFKRLKTLSLFAGIGGFDLGLESTGGFEIVGQVEINEHRRKWLANNYPGVKQWGDIRNVSANDIRRTCRNLDLVCGGFPCQDISQAGKQAGLGGERSQLWWEMWRLVRDLRPRWVLVENVPNLKSKGLDEVSASLEALSYKVWTVDIGGWLVGAPQRRNRIFILAYINGERIAEAARRALADRKNPTGLKESLESLQNGLRERLQRGERSVHIWPTGPDEEPGPGEPSRFLKPGMVADIYGVPASVVIPAIGDSVIPQVVSLVAKYIIDLEGLMFYV